MLWIFNNRNDGYAAKFNNLTPKLKKIIANILFCIILRHILKNIFKTTKKKRIII